MNILWFSWKDESHPEAGGAETVSSEIRKRLAADGHKVRLITSRPDNLLHHETIGGVEIFRNGGRFSVYWKARSMFKKSMTDWPDILIDEMNTLPFFCGYYSKRPSILLTYQLARSVWFYQIMFPFSLIGYIVEPLYLRFMAGKYRLVITESFSTKNDLVKHGFNSSIIKTFRIGMALKPLSKLSPKKNLNSIIYLGAVRPMKRTLDVVKAFEKAKEKMPNLRLTIAGSTVGSYGDKVKLYAQKSRFRDSISFTGRVSAEEKNHLLKDSALIAVTSIKEGWGLIITEANSQGTPAVAYNVDGLRDSVRDKESGLLVPSGSTDMLSEAFIKLLGDKKTFELYRKLGWEWSKEFSFENSYSDFKKILLSYTGKTTSS